MNNINGIYLSDERDLLINFNKFAAFRVYNGGGQTEVQGYYAGHWRTFESFIWDMADGDYVEESISAAKREARKSLREIYGVLTGCKDDPNIQAIHHTT